MEAVALPRTSESVFHANSYVLNHSTNWTLVTQPNRWNTTYTINTFGADTSGVLLLGDGVFGLSVTGELACTYFNLHTWQIEDVNSSDYMSTRHWGITLPGVDGSRLGI